jgi:hypothetical protein
MKTKIHLNFFLFLLIFCSFLLSACEKNKTPESALESLISTTYPDINSSKNNNDNVNEIYPIDEEYLNTRLNQEYPKTLIIPTPEQDTGIVFGKLVTSDSQEPYLAPMLYLGSYIHPEEEIEGMPRAFSLTTEVDPKAIQAQDGTFVFTNVPPGDYGLFIWTPMSLVLVKDSKNIKNENVVVIVQGGKLTDLGTIEIK